MAGEMGLNPGEEFPCVISAVKALVSFHNPGQMLQTGRSLALSWSCSPGTSLADFLSPIRSWAVNWNIFLHQHENSADVPRRECWMRKWLCAHSSRSVCKEKGLGQGRKEHGNISFSRAAVLCLCEATVEPQPNAPFFRRVWQAKAVFSLFLGCFLPVKHSQSVSQEISCCTADVGFGYCSFALQFEGLFSPILVKKLIF